MSSFVLAHNASETGRPRGFAFVQMGSMDEAMAAIDGLNEVDFFGRPLRVSISTPKGLFTKFAQLTPRQPR